MKLIALVIMAFVATGCAGARSSVVLPDSHYPVSLSSGIVGEKGETLKQKDMQTVGHFHEERTAWGTLYSLVRYTPNLDISSSVNEQVAKAGGQGIVGFATETTPCALDYFFFLSLIPFWPGCASVTIDGDIVKQKSAPPVNAAPRTPAAASR